MLHRRQFLMLSAAAAVTGCSSVSERIAERRARQTIKASYGAVVDNGFKLPAVPTNKIDDQYLRQRVDYNTRYRPGTIVVDVPDRFLYLVEPGGKAMRYGVGVGRQGFRWNGGATVGWKREWPTWTPPAPMIRRQPELRRWRKGMPPGLANPLGARALYLTRGGRDTLYRLHGTPEWWSIGKAVSSGCIRLINQDIIDLHGRVKPGAKVIVKQT